MYSERFSNLAAPCLVRSCHLAGGPCGQRAVRIHSPQVNDEISRTTGAFARRFGRRRARRVPCMA